MPDLKPVCILGVGATHVDRWHARGLVSDLEVLDRAVKEALAESGIERADVGALSFTAPGLGTQQRQFSPYATSRLGFRNAGKVCESGVGGWTGGLAFDTAAQEIRIGRARYALALGVWYETGISTAAAMAAAIKSTGDAGYQSPSGATPLSWYAMDAARWLYETGGTRADLAAIAVKNRRHAMRNPLAQFRENLTLSEVLSSRPVVEPFGLYEVSPRGDGSACVVLCNEDVARESGRPYSRVLSSVFAYDGAFQTSGRAEPTFPYRSLAKASRQALGEAGVTISNINLFELYAPSTIVEAISIETLGLAEQGRGGRLAAEGVTALGGKLPVNVSGGLLSRGHPTGVTALYDLIEMHQQLTGEAGDRQVANATFALHACETGKYNGAMVSILARGDA
jgi:acetyl-CoA C-acetyltransferase